MEASSGDVGDAVSAESVAIMDLGPSEEVFYLKSDIHPQVPVESSLTGNYKRLVVDERVTRIAFHAFQSWSQLEFVQFSSLAMDIGISAFAQCSLLKSVDLSSCTILRLGPSVFADCTSLEEITFAENCTVVELQTSTFRKCSSLNHIQIPATVKVIMENCFENCESLTKLRLPIGLVGLQGSAFHGCTFLESMDIPGSITQISMLAFFECHRLKSLQLHEGLLSIADFGFGYCFALENIQIPDTVVTIGFSCFTACSSLMTVELPPLLKRIEDGVFSDCTRLKRVLVPPAVESIGYHAFRSCSSLVSLEIPQLGHLLSMDTNAIEGCTNLRNMALPTTANPCDMAFSNCHKLIRRTNNMDILEALQNRFDGLAVHDLCYHNAKYLRIQEFQDALSTDPEHSFLCRDKLGSNLLQILLLSFHPNHEILLFFIKKYPTCLIPNSFGVRLTIDINVQRVIDDLCQLDELSTIRDVLEASLSHRIQMLGLEEWKKGIYNQIGSLVSSDVANGILRILSNVESLERLETTSLLELAVWKAAFATKSSSARDTKKSTIGTKREQIRVTNGSNVIIPQVTAFLWDVDVD